MNGSIGVVLLAFSTVVQGAAAPFRAAPAAVDLQRPSGPSLSEYASQLNDPRLEVRERVSQRLEADASIAGPDIEAFVKERWEELAPESTERLLMAAQSRFVARPGAIGIEFEQGAAIVMNVRPEAPAARVLRPGDRFISMNGVRLPEDRFDQQAELRRIMSSLRAGDIVSARIRRGGDEIDVTFALADPTQLREFEGYLVEVRREMLAHWNARRRENFPPAVKLAIDLGVEPVDASGRDGASSLAPEERRELIVEELRRRITDVSERIALLAERTQESADAGRRGELEREYLALRDELFGLNARLRLVESNAPGRTRR